MRASISTLFSVLWKRNKARMLSANLEQTLHRALAGANERRHEYATLEHLLLALIDDPDAMAVLRACSVDMERLRADILERRSVVSGKGVSVRLDLGGRRRMKKKTK